MENVTETQSRITQSGDRLRQTATAGKGDKLEKSDFLNLFMYQLSNQNPLEPMDSDKMMSSLSQLGSMEQLQSMNNKFAEMANTQNTLLQFSALGFINHRVEINNDRFDFQPGKDQAFNFKLEKDAVNVRANIINSEGRIVQQLDLGAGTKGQHDLSWNGSTAQGPMASPGKYQVAVNAYDSEGKQVEAKITKEGIISQVKMENNQPLLKVGDEFIPLSEAAIID